MRRRVGVALVIAPPPHAMVLFGDVCEIQKMREGARDRQRFRGRPGPQDFAEAIEVGGVAGASALGEGAHFLDHPEKLVTFLAFQRLAEEVAEETDIVAETFVGGGSDCHAAILSRPT